MDVGLALVVQNATDFDRFADVKGGGTDYTPKISDSQIYDQEIHLARLAGELGFGSIWVAEHHFSPYVLVPDPMRLLSFFAGAIPDVDFGTWVIVAPWHDPIRIAEGITHLDQVLKGRKFFPCFGRGVSKLEYDGMRIPYDQTRERFKESIDIVRLALSGEAFSYDGTHFKIPRVEIRPKPRSKPADLIARLHAAWGSMETMPLTAQMGLAPMINPQRGWDAYREELIKFHAIRTGAGYAPVRPVVANWVICDSSEERALEKARKHYKINADTILAHYEMHKSAQFSNVKGYEGYKARAEELSRAEDPAIKFRDMFIEHYTWGTPEMCYDKIVALSKKVSPEQLICSFSFGGMTLPEAEENLRLFAKEVMPAIKKLPLSPVVGTEENRHARAS